MLEFALTFSQPLNRMRYLTVCVSLALLMLPAELFSQSCSVEYFGPENGETKALQPGQSVGGSLIVTKNGSVASNSSLQLEFQGRTGEKTFAFVFRQITSFLSLGRPPEEKSEEKPLSIYWEGPTSPIKLMGYTFSLAVANGQVSMTMLGHPSEGPCSPAGGDPSNSPAPVGGGNPQALAGLLSLDVAMLQREGVDLSRAAIDGCAPSTSLPGMIVCSGTSSVSSEMGCRAHAIPAIMGMAAAARTNGLSGMYTLVCAKHRLTVRYDKTGAVQVEQTGLPNGTSVFSRQFRY